MARFTLEALRERPPQIDRARMEATSEEDIERHAREDGEDPAAEAGPGLHVIPAGVVRRRLRLSQSAFAQAIHVPLKTVQNWEQGRTSPDPAARALLTILASAPAAALIALNPGRDRHWIELVERAQSKRDRATPHREPTRDPVRG